MYKEATHLFADFSRLKPGDFRVDVLEATSQGVTCLKPEYIADYLMQVSRALHLYILSWVWCWISHLKDVWCLPCCSPHKIECLKMDFSNGLFSHLCLRSQHHPSSCTTWLKLPLKKLQAHRHVNVKQQQRPPGWKRAVWTEVKYLKYFQQCEDDCKKKIPIFYDLYENKINVAPVL